MQNFSSPALELKEEIEVTEGQMTCCSPLPQHAKSTLVKILNFSTSLVDDKGNFQEFKLCLIYF